MPRSLLQTELKQSKPFRIEEEAALNVRRTGAVLARPAEMLMKTHGLSESTYNVLRILRGSSTAPLARARTRDPTGLRAPRRRAGLHADSFAERVTDPSPEDTGQPRWASPRWRAGISSDQEVRSRGSEATPLTKSPNWCPTG